MFSLRNRFGIPGVISVIALVFAMLGGAYAASNNSGAGKATASAKAKRGPRGPRGPEGPAGPSGPQGPAGASGKDGAAGKAGTNGTNGTSGADGKSVTVTAVQTGATECNGLGGAIDKQEGAGSGSEVCNGEEGAAGPEGQPWTAGGTLPVEKTETGVWALVGNRQTVKDGNGNNVVIGDGEVTQISFAIPLAAKLKLTKIIAIDATTMDPVHCPGSAEKPASPPPASGYLCLYQAAMNNIFPFPGLTNVGVGGILIELHPSADGVFSAKGSWAVTG